jgi:thiamine-monophosphate kinase
LIKPERQLIASISRLAQRSANRAVLQGIGDDCAILRIAPRSQLLVTTDLCVERVHFRREWHPASSVGHRCLARGLSDIAAMGGEPLACFLSIGLPANLPQRWVDDFLRGLLRLARRFGVELAGGDTSAAHDITADIIVIGQVLTDKAPAGKALLRSTARPGDRIYVTGELGASAAVLEQLYSGKKVKPSPGNRHFYPEPRLEVGKRLRRLGLATAMIDISDGLSVDLAHICKESGVSATIHADSIPIAGGATLELALHGGEDYELLFTAPKRLRLPAKIAGVRVTQIGTMLKRSANPSVHIIGVNGQARLLKPQGWQHFSKRG